MLRFSGFPRFCDHRPIFLIMTSLLTSVDLLSVFLNSQTFSSSWDLGTNLWLWLPWASAGVGGGQGGSLPPSWPAKAVQKQYVYKLFLEKQYFVVVVFLGIKVLAPPPGKFWPPLKKSLRTPIMVTLAKVYLLRLFYLLSCSYPRCHGALGCRRKVLGMSSDLSKIGAFIFIQNSVFQPFLVRGTLQAYKKIDGLLIGKK